MCAAFPAVVEWSQVTGASLRGTEARLSGALTEHDLGVICTPGSPNACGVFGHPGAKIRCTFGANRACGEPPGEIGVWRSRYFPVVDEAGETSAKSQPKFLLNVSLDAHGVRASQPRVGQTPAAFLGTPGLKSVAPSAQTTDGVSPSKIGVWRSGYFPVVDEAGETAAKSQSKFLLNVSLDANGIRASQPRVAQTPTALGYPRPR